MPGSPFPIRQKLTSRNIALKEAIVASFALDPDPARTRLAGFDESDWLSVLWWLDIRGMAIYFYRRACEIGAEPLLPRDVEAGLAQRLSNTRVRTKALLDEARVLATWFQRGNIAYSLLTGITHAPQRAQESALINQTGLDFLIPERSVDLAIHYVHRLGYRLHAQNVDTLEFRADTITVPDSANIYPANTPRALELHPAKDGTGESQLLSRRVICEFGGSQFYVLSPADNLVVQARRLLKHLCSEHIHLPWVLEFWRHIGSQRGDTDFWYRAESCAAALAHGNVAVGIAFWLAEDLFCPSPADVPRQWRIDALPVPAKLWLERYARTVLLSDTIGNKLCVLLRRELLGSAQHHRTDCQRLLPTLSPAEVLKVRLNESRSQLWARCYVETCFILRRLWSHFRESVRFAVEISRWNRAVARIGR